MNYSIKQPLAYALAAALLAYVLVHIDWDMLKHSATLVKWPWAGVALMALAASQYVSMLRMRLYAKELASVDIEPSRAWKIYMRGMWMSIALPGNVGGDGWKAWFIVRQYSISWRQAVWLQLSERCSGFAALIAAALLIYPYTSIYPLESVSAWGIGMVIPIIYAAYMFGARRVLHEPLALTIKAGLLSWVIQLCVVAAIAALVLAVGSTTGSWSLVWVGLVASLLASLPLSIGGIGLREFTYLQAAAYMGAPYEPMVLIGLLLSILYVLLSLTGIKPLSVTTD